MPHPSDNPAQPDEARPGPGPSVVWRMGAWIAAIAGLAMVSILASITVAELSSGEARAINLAGSLRMQSYLIDAIVSGRDDPGNAQAIEDAFDEFEARYRAPALQQAMQEMIRSKLTSVQRMEVTSNRMGEDDILEKVLTSDVEMIRATLEQTSRTDFRQAVDVALKQNPDLLGVQAQMAQARAGIAQAEGARLPKITVSAGVNSRYASASPYAYCTFMPAFLAMCIIAALRDRQCM